MSTIVEQRCLNHHDREAVARCPVCRDFYCRECVTEHEGRVICAKCLAGMMRDGDDGRSARSLIRPILALGSFVVAWLFFFLLGRTLLMLPDSFHDGTAWITFDAEYFEEDEL